MSNRFKLQSVTESLAKQFQQVQHTALMNINNSTTLIMIENQGLVNIIQILPF